MYTPPDPSLREAITRAYRADETALVRELAAQSQLSASSLASVRQRARALVVALREGRANASGVDNLMQEFSLSSQEGVALMCLAEAMLRIPDTATVDRLIRDKIGRGDWRSHLGNSPSLFVNAASWGLLITGKLTATSSEIGMSSALTRLISKGGEPLIRKGVGLAMRLLGRQFVTGEDIASALRHSREQEARGYCYSYDMLGEAALTAADAERYAASYTEAIHAIGAANAGRGVYQGPGISVKLSALHPRFTRAQRERVLGELLPRLKQLMLLAKGYDISFNIDAEEADRLDLSLDLIEPLALDPELAGWHGLGVVVQAYLKRCPRVIDYLVDLARRSGHRLMIRLVKGAYWDSEIKRAQVDGQDGYPVYTRKAHTDVAYLACARQLLAAGDAVYSQFATHNAHSLSFVYQMGLDMGAGDYEFQCLHGMGESLYDLVVGPEGLGKPCRIYAPVGSHETLLPYLVRRLLENGANSSFVNRIVDESVSIDELIADPVDLVAREGGRAHPQIPLPRDLHGPDRINSRGVDLSNESTLSTLGAELGRLAGRTWRAAPMLAGKKAGRGETGETGESAAGGRVAGGSVAGGSESAGRVTGSGVVGATAVQRREIAERATAEIRNPADRADLVGFVAAATLADVDAALASAAAFAPEWQRVPAASRAALLEDAAALLEAHTPELISLCIREAGKSWPNAVAEVREAVDFCRYYAQQSRLHFAGSPAEPLGPVVCISPWNFPLAIFTGEVAAGLAAGNPVLAKPAEQTPLIAALAVRLFHEAGVPPAALQLLPGPGETVGAALTADHRVRGVIFTGSTEVAQLIQRALAARAGADGEIALIAETGGQNAMIVDSSALPEQVVADAMSSAFDSAGQRCSALRVLCVQEEFADHLLAMLRAAMAELRIGQPAQLATDVGPVIDAAAKEILDAHIARMRAVGYPVTQLPLPAECGAGTFVGPALIELPSIAVLEREVFGPVLHVVRYRRDDLEGLLEAINDTGYGLTLGVHSRIDETIDLVVSRARVGNIYVNRNIVGAVVGVQPFGGEGKSGTGPKAGGPLYLQRLVRAPCVVPAALVKQWSPDRLAAQAAQAATPQTPQAPQAAHAARAALDALENWAGDSGDSALATACRANRTATLLDLVVCLPGPTGEVNTLRFAARGRLGCDATTAPQLLEQIAAALATGNDVAVADTGIAAELLPQLPAAVRARMSTAADWRDEPVALLLAAGDPAAVADLRRIAAAREGALVPVVEADRDGVYPLHRLVVERALSVNTAAAGGNASLMTLVP